MFDKKKQRYIKKQETSGLLSDLVVEIPLSNIQYYWYIFQRYKVNVKVNNFVLI